MWGVGPHFYGAKFKRKFRSKTLVPESPQPKNTTRRRSTSSKVLKQSGNGRECLLETRTNVDCIIWFTKFSIIPIDEHLAGFCTKIEVLIHVDGSISVRDNGRGIPVDVHPKWKMPAIELVLTNLHAGGKFGQGAYKYSGGLHGVGAKCTNALSEWFKAEVSREGKVYHMAFAKGKTTDKLTVIGEVKNKKTTGTLITFLPDPTIFTITTEFKFERLATRLRELAFLNPGLEITLTDERIDPPKKERFFYKHGIEEFVRQLGENKQVLHPKPIVIARQRDEVFVDVVLQYNDSYNDQILPFANSIANPDGGTHLTGFRTALTRAINQYAKQNSLLKDKDPSLSGDDVREGLIAGSQH
jgi:DNA gyrase subunit B